jgi:cytochrome c oxidase subunit IV
MTATTEAPAEGDEHGHRGHHPTPRDYVRIAVILAALTALEVSVHFFEYPVRLAFWMLVVLAVMKFLYVVLWYMHLKFDSKLFNRLFGFGVVLALTVFAILVVIMVIFTPGEAAVTVR